MRILITLLITACTAFAQDTPIVFGEVSSPFSDGAKLIIDYGKKRLFRDDWKRVFEPESVQEQVKAIVEGVK